MESGIFSEGKEYISASRVSKQIGYSSDYLGQLCRAKKLPGKLIGRTWYIDLKSAIEYKQAQEAAKKKKLPPPQEITFTYEADFQPQLPVLLKSSRTSSSGLKLVGEVVLTTLALVVATSLTLSMLTHVAPTLAQVVEEKVEALSVGVGATLGDIAREASGRELVAAPLSATFSTPFVWVIEGFQALRAVALGTSSTP
jgi:hypothetical protein